MGPLTILAGITWGLLIIWFLVAALIIFSYSLNYPREEIPKFWPLGVILWPWIFVLLAVAVVCAGVEYVYEACIEWLAKRSWVPWLPAWYRERTRRLQQQAILEIARSGRRRR